MTEALLFLVAAAAVWLAAATIARRLALAAVRQLPERWLDHPAIKDGVEANQWRPSLAGFAYANRAIIWFLAALAGSAVLWALGSGFAVLALALLLGTFSSADDLSRFWMRLETRGRTMGQGSSPRLRVLAMAMYAAHLIGSAAYFLAAGSLGILAVEAASH